MEPLLRMETPDLIAAAATAAAGAMVVASWFARHWWIGELTSHWTRHLAAALVPVTLFALWRGDWGLWWAAAFIACAGDLPWQLAGRERRGPRHAGGPSFSLLAANLLDRNRQRVAALTSVLASPAEVVVLVEVLPSDEAELRRDPRRPFQSWHHDRRYGTAILSAHPLSDIVIADQCQGALVAVTITVADQRLRLFAIHPYSPKNPTRMMERNRQFAALAGLVAAETLPVAVAGDFNLTVGNPAWRDLRRRAGLRRHAGAEPATFPAHLGALGIAIDHVLVRGLGLDGLRAVAIPGSDHRGLQAILSLPPAPSAERTHQESNLGPSA